MFLHIECLVSEAKKLKKNVFLKNGACASIIFLCVLIAIKLLFKLWQSLAYAVNSLKVTAKFAKSFLTHSPEVPRRSASRDVDVGQLGVNRPDGYPDSLLLLVPEDLEADLHVDLALVGHVLASAACDLHAAKEAKVDTLPDPGSGVDRNIELSGNHHRVVLKKADFQAFLSKFEVVTFP